MEGEEYESSEILLEIAKDEYKNEIDRTSVIDTKVSIALPIIATYFFMVLQFESVKSIFSKQLDTRNAVALLYSLCNPFIYLAAIICAGASLIFLLRAIITQSYQKIDSACFNKKEIMSMPKKVFSAVMVTYFIRALEHNKEVNDTRVALYKKGLIFVIISLGLFVIYYFLTK